MTVHLSCSRGLSMEDAAHRIAAVLAGGGVVLYPSDTVYGLLCMADDRKAVERLRSIKGYTEPRPFILLVDGLEMARRVADCGDPQIRRIMDLLWPGRLTLVLPSNEGCPEWVRGRGDTVAVRHPGDVLSGALLAAAGMPLVSTSANATGSDCFLDYALIPESITGRVDLALDAGVLPAASPSTILKLLRSSGDG